MRRRTLIAAIVLWSACAAAAVRTWAADEPPSVPTSKSGPAAAATVTTPPTTDSASPASAKEPGSPAGVVEVKPEVFYVRDKDNRLVPVPGFSYEDFIKYYRLKEQLDHPDVKPRFNLEQMTLTGAAEGERAELTVSLKILVLDSQWVRIPLRMNKCALREPAGYRGDGDEFLQFEPNGDGYVAWLRGKGRGEHELTLKLLAPLSVTSGESRLELALPTAAAAKLALHVPSPGAVVSSSSGNNVPEVAADGKGSLISALGPGGDFSLVWHGPEQPAARRSAALEASGAIFVRIDGRSVASEATLTVRSFGAEFDHFRVRLPAGGQLTGGQQPGYSLSPVGDAGASLVEVKLDRKTAGPVEVRLLAERAYDVTKPGENLDLAGFAVLEAIPHRQWGHIAVAVSGDWQLSWGDRTRVRQTDDLPEGLRRKDLVAGFQYFGQPSSLVAKISPRKTRVSVEPRYTYRVEAERTSLEARLKYTVRGARLFKLELNLHGWEIDSLGPEGVVDANSVATDGAGITTIPLVAPLNGELELVLKAHRNNAVGAKAIEWALPEPQVDVAGPAEVVIVPADNVELTPLGEKIAGLSRSMASTAATENQPSALNYRSENVGATFAAGFEVHSQSLTVEMETHASLRLREIDVEQILNYQIRYEPLDRLTLDVPRQLYDDGRLKFAIDGKSVEAREVGEQPAADRRSVHIPLKQPLVGAVRLTISYRMPESPLPSSGTAAFGIPLVVPTDSRLLSHLALVAVDAGIHVEQREGPWSVSDGARDASPGSTILRLSANESAPEIRLAAGLDARQAGDVTFIDRAWIQTWLTTNVRQDRAVYNVVTDAPQLRLTLPAGISPADVELIVDGKDAAPAATTAASLTIDIPAGHRNHVLELRYQFAGLGAASGWQGFDVPQFDKQVKLRHLYWQLVVPSDETLLGAGGGLSADYIWSWRDFGLGFERVSLKEQRQLEDWVGLPAASAKGPINSAADEPPPSSNRYLFSALGGSAKLEIMLAPRWLVMLVASFTALLSGLSVIYLPALRRPRTLIAAAAGLLVLIVVWPDPAVLIAQAASLGLGLSLFAFALQRVFAGWRAQEPSSRLVLPRQHERSSQRTSQRRTEPAKSPTTTASIAVAVADGDGGSALEAEDQPDRTIGGSTSRLQSH